MLELLAVPQRGIPRVQLGFRIVLYISNLFSIDSSELSKWGCKCGNMLKVQMDARTHRSLCTFTKMDVEVT